MSKVALKFEGRVALTHSPIRRQNGSIGFSDRTTWR